MQTAVDIAAAVRAGRLTARQATQDALRRIEDVDPRINAFQEVRTFAALREADAVDARPDRADLPLAGVPLVIKDNLPVAGEPMRDGSKGSDPSPQHTDHEIVRRLRNAGAVVVALTRVPELCVYGATDSAFGITRNPWDPDRTPGGSSGGSAAAVAAGTVPIAHGNDGMGSIRIPAACCGLVGIKPGLGVVPADLGNGSWFDMAENGALATTVADVALMLSVLADRPELAVVEPSAELRVAVAIGSPVAFSGLDKHWKQAARTTGDLLRGAGHQVSDVQAPYGQAALLSAMVRWFAGAEMDARTLTDRNQLGTAVRRHAAAGRALMRLGLPRAKGRLRWQARAGRFFVDHDVLVTPALAHPPIAAAAWSQRGWLNNLIRNARYAPYAALWNLAGWPAMSVPAGLDPHGLPLAVQLVAPPGNEARLLSVAAQLEQLRPWQRLAPTANR
ncbi:MAG: amidase [Pseudonocardiales bacterium]|nr:amidase [Pseudonocardiales bacterium]